MQQEPNALCSGPKEVTPTDRLSRTGTCLAACSCSLERFPRGRRQHYGGQWRERNTRKSVRRQPKSSSQLGARAKASRTSGVPDIPAAVDDQVLAGQEVVLDEGHDCDCDVVWSGDDAQWSGGYERRLVWDVGLFSEAGLKPTGRHKAR